MTFISVFTASPEHVLLTVENTSTLSGGRKFLSNMKEGEGTAVRKVRFSHFPFFGRGVDPADRKANETGPWELSAAFFFTPVTCPSQASSVSLSYPSHFLPLSALVLQPNILSDPSPRAPSCRKLLHCRLC